MELVTEKKKGSLPLDSEMEEGRRGISLAVAGSGKGGRGSTVGRAARPLTPFFLQWFSTFSISFVSIFPSTSEPSRFSW